MKLVAASSIWYDVADSVSTWPVDHPACVLVSTDGPLVAVGDVDRVLPWASVTKVLAALAVVDVVQDGLLDLDEPAGPEGSTIRHLLAHTSGLAFDEDRIVAAPGAKRVYSNVGIDLVTEIAAGRAGLRHGRALIEQRVLTPLGMADTVINGPASHGAAGSTFDLARLADELLSPRVLRPEVIDACATPQFPGLSGVLPGFGRQADNLWGLGCELRGTKDPHWLPASADPASFGHFGQSGSFLWVDRSAGLAVVAATGTAFGPWAAQAWPRDLGRWLESWGRVPVAARQWELVS